MGVSQSEVPAEQDGADAPIALSESSQEVTGSIRGHVVDDNQLPAHSQLIQGLSEAAMKLGERLELVVTRHHNRDIGAQRLRTRAHAPSLPHCPGSWVEREAGGTF
jgi:hypothetical protein